MTCYELDEMLLKRNQHETIGLNLAVMFFVRLGPNEIEILVMLYVMYSNESPSLYMKTHSALTFETQDEISQYPRMCSKRRKNAKGRMHLE